MSELVEIVARVLAERNGVRQWQVCAKDALAALRAIEGAGYEIEPGWQPIETAPKNGTHILACISDRPFGWRDLKALPPIQTVVHWYDDPDEPGFYTSVNEIAPDNPFSATHWRPLPAPPAFDAAPLRGEG